MLPSNHQILFTRQIHDAKKAGKHFDIRLVHGEKAYSWATRKDLPVQGEAIMIYEQPVHTTHYALQQHIHIPDGQYGAGTTILDFVKKARVGPDSTQDKFVLHVPDGTRFLFKRMSEKYGRGNPWLLKNLGPEKEPMANKYLEKIAANRLVQEIAKGTVKMPLKALVAKGALRGPGVYSKGMQRGNTAIAKKLGVDISKDSAEGLHGLASAGGGYASINTVKKGPVALHGGLKNNFLKEVGAHPVNHHQAAIRHELFEVKDMKALSTSRRRRYSDADMNMMRMKTPLSHAHMIDKVRPMKPDVFASKGKLVGQHMTPRVLTQESEMIRKNPYLGGMRRVRSETGEDKLITSLTGKRFGVDKMTGKDHAKAFKSSGGTPKVHITEKVQADAIKNKYVKKVTQNKVYQNLFASKKKRKRTALNAGMMGAAAAGATAGYHAAK